MGVLKITALAGRFKFDGSTALQRRRLSLLVRYQRLDLADMTDGTGFRLEWIRRSKVGAGRNGMELLLIVLFVMAAGERIRRWRALRARAERLALSRVEAIAQVYGRSSAS